VVLLILLASLASLNAIMVLTGLSWNLLNGIAFPLLVGLGIDYGIHLIFALRRQRIKPKSLWRGVGLGIAFCGMSSAIGFGSLGLASNELLKSLGTISVIGIAFTSALSLLVIPPAWRALCAKKD